MKPPNSAAAGHKEGRSFPVSYIFLKPEGKTTKEHVQQEDIELMPTTQRVGAC